MSNTATVEARPRTASSYRQPDESDDLPPLRLSRTRVKPVQRSRKNWFLQGENYQIAVRIFCISVIGILCFAFLAAFARVTWQGDQLREIDHQMKNAASQHVALVKNIATLTSVHYISEKVVGLQMSQGGSSEYIDVSSPESQTRREVASAL
jgi:hypothetical protein